MRSCKRIYIKVINATIGAFAVVWRRRARRCRGIKQAGITDVFEFELQLLYNGRNVENQGERILQAKTSSCCCYLFLRELLIAYFDKALLSAFALVHLLRSAIFSHIILRYSIRAKEPR
jgi:hypothetical protein